MQGRDASLALPLRSGGFTLLEMLVVLAMAGLIAGLLYPQVQTAAFAIQQRQAREQIAAGAEGARALAMRSGQPATLSAMQGGMGLVITVPQSGVQAVAGRQLPLAATGSLRLTLRPQGIVFYPDGSTSGGHIELISGPSKSAGTATFVIDHAAGHLREAGTDKGTGTNAGRSGA